MTPRQFAISVVEKLQDAGYEALWAGGCVRDQLLGRQPKDYDVATSAHPDQIRELFGTQRTLAIGAAFGVITVLGPKPAGQIEVATFRRDSGYSDGRHPDLVEFTDAREDAIRRDFTINGIFLDPLTKQVIDYVGGQDDLRQKKIRAIGNPHERIDEDKLRMLRGVRFAATFDFELDQATMVAIRQHAAEIKQVSPERIGVELIRMLAHPNKAVAARLLLESELLSHVLPAKWFEVIRFDSENWQLRLQELATLAIDEFEVAAFLLLRSFLTIGSDSRSPFSELKDVWRLTNQQAETLAWISRHWQTLAIAESRRWSEIQPLLIQPAAKMTLAAARAITGGTVGIDYCAERLQWPAEKLDLSPFLSGGDLIALGVEPGPQFKTLLQAIRDGQLDGEIKTVDEARQRILHAIGDSDETSAP